ncbi:MAG: hypothetical protein JWL76_1719 [Thermoleophilia bacterium]|nr:hypothetical protein [Thermoleophilia bacterium]
MLLVIPACSSAASVTWDGGAGTTDWNTATNWSGNAIPTNADDVSLGPGANVLLDGGPDAAAATLDVSGTLQTREPLVVTGPIIVHSSGTIGVERCPWLRSTSGQSRIEAGGTIQTNCLIRFANLENAGAIFVQRNGLVIDNTFSSSGIISGSGSITTPHYVDVGITSFQGVINSGDGTLAGTHSICSLYGSWHVTTGTLTVPKTCQLHLGSFVLDAAGRVNVSVDAMLTDATSRPIQVDGNAQLDGAIHIDGAWGVDLTPAPRTAIVLLATTRSGTPTITTAPGFAPGPAPWTAVTTLDGRILKVTIAEPIAPSAVGSIERSPGGSTLHAHWAPATDEHSGIRGYSVEIDQVPDTIPDATSDTTSPDNGSTSAPGTYFVHVRAIDRSGNPGPTSHAGPWVVHAAGEWSGLGATDDWQDPDNWIGNQVPEAGADITIAPSDVGAHAGPHITAGDVEVGLMQLAGPITIDPTRSISAYRIDMSGVGDLIGGAATITELGAYGPGVRTMSSIISGLRHLTVNDGDVRINGSVGPGDIFISGDGADVELTGSVNGGVMVGYGSSLSASAVTVPDGSQLSVAGSLVVSGTVVTATGLTLESNATFRAATFEQGAGGISFIGGGSALEADVEVHGGFFGTSRSIDGDLTMHAGEFAFAPDAAPYTVSGSFAMHAPATYSPSLSGADITVGGTAIVNGVIDVLGEQPTTAWGVVEPIIRAAGGVTGTPRLVSGNEPSRVRVAFEPGVLGVTPVDRIAPVAPVMSATLGPLGSDITATISVSWAYQPSAAETADGRQAPIDGYSMSIDASPNGAADQQADVSGTTTSSSGTVPRGLWYVHVRARDADGNWGATSHAGPFAVGPPIVTTPPNAKTDRCSNIPGAQTTLPARTIARADGSCVTTASAGPDVLWGSARIDVLLGGRGADRLYGAGGNDRLVGGPGRDRLDGGAGADVLDARDRAGGDIITCGPGRDTVLFNRGDHVARDCERRRLAT